MTKPHDLLLDVKKYNSHKILGSNSNTCNKKGDKVFIFMDDHTLNAGLVLHLLWRVVGSYSRKW